MRCIVSGGTGFIGRQLVKRLRRDGHEVAVWGREPGESMERADAILHLAGEPVAQRWNAAVKARIRDSRVLGTRRIVEMIRRAEHKPRVLVSASAIGVYGDRGDEILTETSAPGRGFLADLCQAWEAEAHRAPVRVVTPRIGFVLGSNGGALAQIVPVFRWGAGGRLGSGRQWIPWVHIEDVCDMLAWAIENESISGVLNTTSPNPVRNAEFTSELARAVHRPAIFPVPPFALKIAFGELAQHMLDSYRVIPEAALKAEFRFRYPDLRTALAGLAL